MMNWGVYINGDRNKRFLSYISQETAKGYALKLNSNKGLSEDVFVPLEMELLVDEPYTKNHNIDIK